MIRKLLLSTLLLLMCLAAYAKSEQTFSLNINGVARSYIMYIPDNVKENAPLVFSLHGTGGHSKDHSPFGTDVADHEGCIVVYPQGETFWFPVFFSNVPGWHATGEYTADLDFFKAIIEDVAQKHAIDRKRIYCCGFSNGGMMTYTVANQLSDTFAAFASISGYPINEFHLHHTSDRPVPFLHIHGKKDDFVRYVHVPKIIDDMVARDGANPVPVKTRGNGYDKSVYEAGEGGFPVVFYEIDNMGHNDFTWDIENNHSGRVMWEFMSQYTLDSPCDKTLKWAPRIEQKGFDAQSHGFSANGKNLLQFGGEQKTDANQNVYHSLQLKKGHYHLAFYAQGNTDAKLNVKITKLNGNKEIVLNTQVSPRAEAYDASKMNAENLIKLPFVVNDLWAEYQLTVSTDDASMGNCTLGEISIHSMTQKQFTSIRSIEAHQSESSPE